MRPLRQEEEQEDDEPSYNSFNLSVGRVRESKRNSPIHNHVLNSDSSIGQEELLLFHQGPGEMKRTKNTHEYQLRGAP